MIEDMIVAVKDLRNVTFIIESVNPRLGPSPRIEGSRYGKTILRSLKLETPKRNCSLIRSLTLGLFLAFCRVSLRVILPVPDSILESAAFLNTSVDESKFRLSFGLTPVFLNIGINEQATIAER